MRRKERLEAIRKANELIYEQTDKMKMLKSQRGYADVVHTRFQQIDRKGVSKENDKVTEKQFHEEILRQVAHGESVEQAKLEQRQRQIEEVKVSRKVQLDAVRQRAEEEKNKDLAEGLRMKADAQARLEEDLRNQEAKQRKAAATTVRMMQANQDMKVLRLEMTEKERLAELDRDAEVEIIAKRKQDLKNLEKQRFEKSQLTRQRMIDAAVYQLSIKKSADEVILNKQELEIKTREDKAIADKQAKLDRTWNETVASRTAMLTAKDQALRRQQIEDEKLANRWREENEEGIRREAKKQSDARAEQTRIKNIQLNDGRDQVRRRAEEKLIENEQSKFLSSLSSNDDSRFVEICKAEIERNISLGKPVYTLLRALEFAAPQLQAAKTISIKREKKTEG
jgi:hypothetical protein